MRFVYSRQRNSDPNLMVWFADDRYTRNMSPEIISNLKPVTNASAKRFVRACKSFRATHQHVYADVWVAVFPDKGKDTQWVGFEFMRHGKLYKVIRQWQFSPEMWVIESEDGEELADEPMLMEHYAQQHESEDA